MARMDVLTYQNLEHALYEGVGKYGIPEIDPVYECPATKWLGFNYVKTTAKAAPDTGVHFFLDDYQFERVWNSPNVYVPYLKKFSCVLSPDFSLYADFPKAVQIWNHYRKHWMARYWRDNGITVIPTIAWSDESSFEWCFDREPRRSVVAVSNVGCMAGRESKLAFEMGYEKMLETLEPSLVLFYAHKFGNYAGNVRYVRHTIGFAEEMAG